MTAPLPFVKTLKLGSRGPAVEASKRAVYKFLNDGKKWVGFTEQAPVVRRTFGPFFRKDLILAQQAMTVGKDGVLDEPTLRGLEQYMDQPARALWLQQFPAKPQISLGPVIPRGKSVLDQDLTHATGGLPGYPAFDDGFGQPGTSVIALETLTITRASSAERRDGTPNGKAFYATGASKLRYWFGHVDAVPTVGRTFAKGETLARISPNHEEPHVHVGIYATDLIGHELVHHTDYSHGSPTVGKQLEGKH